MLDISVVYQVHMVYAVKVPMLSQEFEMGARVGANMELNMVVHRIYRWFTKFIWSYPLHSYRRFIAGVGGVGGAPLAPHRGRR